MDTGEQYDFYMSIQEKLERGVPIVIFPEGTRSRDSKMGKFYDGTFKLAVDTKADIVPVILDSWNIIRPGAYWIRDTVTTFRVLDTMKYEDYQQYSYKELAKVMRIKMTEALLSLRDERRAKEKYYYRKKQKFVELDNQMREELKEQKEKYGKLLTMQK
jgi:1-acyl-sn-glycerol-3-phosphate acyltransferase